LHEQLERLDRRAHRETARGGGARCVLYGAVRPRGWRAWSGAAWGERPQQAPAYHAGKADPIADRKIIDQVIWDCGTAWRLQTHGLTVNGLEVFLRSKHWCCINFQRGMARRQRLIGSEKSSQKVTAAVNIK